MRILVFTLNNFCIQHTATLIIIMLLYITLLLLIYLHVFISGQEQQHGETETIPCKGHFYVEDLSSHLKYDTLSTKVPVQANGPKAISKAKGYWVKQWGQLGTRVFADNPKENLLSYSFSLW